MCSRLFIARSHFVAQEYEVAEDSKQLSFFAEMIIVLWPLSAQHMNKLFSRSIARQET
jgi:hypothetical protein